MSEKSKRLRAALNRPELEERLHGFSNAIAELINERHAPLDPSAVNQVAPVAKVGPLTVTKGDPLFPRR